MKKIMALLGLVVLVVMGCGASSIEKTLTEGNGEWKIVYGSRDIDYLKFYDDGNVEFTDSTRTHIVKTGTYNIDKKNKRIVISLPNKKKIFDKVKLQSNDKISVTYAETQRELIKEE